MDQSLEHHQNYIGRPVTDLPTPSLILSRPIIEDNIGRLHENISKLGIGFRPHVKTLKALEVTAMMLGGGKYRKTICSTLAEMRGMLPLVQRNILDECLYGLPIRPGALPELLEHSKTLRVVLMIDNEDHVRLLEEFNQANSTAQPWHVFIKVNIGDNRAGAPSESERLKQLTKRAGSSNAVSITGFYCYANQSYDCRSEEQAESVLQKEVNATLRAVKELPTDQEVIVSIGSTPIAHIVDKLKASLPTNVKLELHAGNFAVTDLQQVSTGLIDMSRQAMRICAEVCSVYPERNEALLNAGVLALTREISEFPGFARVVDRPNWSVVRMSQEHGILGLTSESASESVVDNFKIGQKVLLNCQHACITAAAHHVYYVVDKDDIVRETWKPWKGW